MSDIKHLAQVEATLKALADAVDGRLKEVRASMQAELETLRTDTGATSITAALPDGTAVATISLPKNTPTAAIDDQEAFLQWAIENAPTEIERTFVGFVTTVRPAYVKKILAEMDAAGAPQICDVETGVVWKIPGASVRPRRASSHSVRFKTNGKDLIGAAWRNGQLGLDTIMTAAIETAGDEK